MCRIGVLANKLSYRLVQDLFRNPFVCRVYWHACHSMMPRHFVPVLCLLLRFGTATSSVPTCSGQTGHIIGAGGRDVGNKASLADCCAACLKDASCAAFTWDSSSDTQMTEAEIRKGGASCWLKDNIQDMGPCNHGTCTSGLSGRKPTPAPSPSSHSQYACGLPDSANYVFCDANLTLNKRLEDLVPRIHPEEMASQLTARECSSLDRLGIPAVCVGGGGGLRLESTLCKENIVG